jgi:hypothetical protein
MFGFDALVEGGIKLPTEVENLSVNKGSREKGAGRRSLRGRLLVTCALIALLLCGFALLPGTSLHAWAMALHHVDGHVYILNNNLSGSNSITVFNREEDGSLALSGSTSIGGLGSVAAFADGTQGSLFITHDERTRLFAVDAGSNQISVVDDGFGFPGSNNTGAVTAYRLSHGAVSLINGPVPDFQLAPCWMVITYDGRFAYTSNADSHNISGLRIGWNGAVSLLNANGVTASTPPDTFPLEEGLSRNSNYLYALDSRLLLTTPGPATISGFRIHSYGSLSSVVDPSQIVLPFSAIGLAAE